MDAKICQAIDNDDEEQGEIDRKQAKRFMDKFRKKNWIVDVKKKARNVLRELGINCEPRGVARFNCAAIGFYIWVIIQIHTL